MTKTERAKLLLTEKDVVAECGTCMYFRRYGHGGSLGYCSKTNGDKRSYLMNCMNWLTAQ